MELGKIERRCRRVNRTVMAPAADQVTLLRAARILKKTHDELSLAVMHWAIEAGRTADVRSAEQALLAMDRELRKVLLEYARLSQKEMAVCLKDALGVVFSVTELLRADPATSAVS